LLDQRDGGFEPTHSLRLAVADGGAGARLIVRSANWCSVKRLLNDDSECATRCFLYDGHA
jgi:hypothetical protein